MTATVTNSKILGTGTDTSDYGITINDGKLIVKGTSTIQSPIEGVDLVGGTIKATKNTNETMVAGE